MSSTRSILAAFGMAVAAAASQAQFVKGNEAVKLRSDGTKTVETPPLPSIQLAPPCRAENPSCAMGGWLMVETRDGLRECTEFYARQGSCRASTYGVERLPRRWVVRIKGQWMQCQYPDISSVCVSTKALPPDDLIQ